MSAFVAVRTGSAQEDRVERVVPEKAIDTHEDAAERFLVFSEVLVLVSAAGLVRGTIGQAGRLLTTVGALGLVAAGVQVGHSGGQLVYRDGAASAYTTSSGTPTREAAVDRTRNGHRSGDDDR